MTDKAKRGLMAGIEAIGNYNKEGKGEHYQGSIEVIDMMVRIWGVEKTILWCEMTIFKYRMRIGKKDKAELELTKIKWYEDKIKELKLS